MGTHWSIPNSDVEYVKKQQEDPEQQPRPRGRRNVRGRRERGHPVRHNAPMGGANFGEEAMGGYFDQLSLSMNWIGGTVENMF